MSENLKSNHVANNRPVRNTSFSGGVERGRCFQMTQVDNTQEVNVVNMTKEQVVQQMTVMAQWLSDS